MSRDIRFRVGGLRFENLLGTHLGFGLEMVTGILLQEVIFINVPWYFSMLYSVFSPFLTQRTKSKFVLSKEGNAAETLYKYIRPEDVPVQYGGLSRPSDSNTGPPKPASEFTVKGGEKVNIQIEGIEAGATITWDIVVGGWDLEYSAEYVPIADGSYTIAVEKSRKMAPTEEAVHNSYTAKEAGKLVLSVDNSASRKRKVASYRYLVRKSTVVMYIRPEDVPVQYGGLSRPSDSNTGPPKPASEFTVKGGEKESKFCALKSCTLQTHKLEK
nr:patellin-6 [Tanacetum cinerariifolium]